MPDVCDTPSQLFLRRPVGRCKRDSERLKEEEEKTRRRKEISDKVRTRLTERKVMTFTQNKFFWFFFLF